MVDLHMHSQASDGSETPAEIIARCEAAGLTLNAITDHDNIDSQEAAVAESVRRRRPYLTGVEISVQYTGELHILGYGMDIHQSGFQQMMEDLRQSRVERIGFILKSLAEHGIDVRLEDVEAAAAGNTLGRPHVALALAAKGYAPGYREAYETYLNEGGLCYVRRRKLNARQAIDLIRSAGGVPVLAHPGLITTDDLGALVHTLADAGLGGIEAFYPAHSDGQCAEYSRLAADLGLIVTCGSDSHGIYRDNAIGCEKRTSQLLEKSVETLLALSAS